MPNTILTPNIIAKEALMVLRNNAVMANLVHRDYSEEFAKVGDTVNVRKPAKFVANEFDQSTGIVIQDANEGSVPVVMDKLLDVSFAVTTKELSLSIDDFSERFLTPAMQGFADKIDNYLIALEASVTNRVAHASGIIAPADIIAVRKLIGAKGAPLTDRRLVMGVDAEADLLTDPLFVSAEKVGDNGTALREASMGRKFGFDCYVDQNIVKTTGSGAHTPTLAFHKNAFALVTRTPELPLGAANAFTVNHDGFGLRVVYGYDMVKKTDTISIDMLCGVKLLDANLAGVIADAR